eukprot:gene61938-84702_t
MLNLLLALLAGIVTIATPCTLPVLPILLGSSVGQTSKIRPALIAFGFVVSFSAVALLLGGFLLLGRHPASVIFVALGTLTGSYACDRLARGWYYLGGQNGIPSIPPMTLGSYELTEGPVYYYVALGFLIAVYLLCRFLMRSQFGLALAGLREN